MDISHFTNHEHPEDAVFNEYLDGRLSQGASADLENHVAVCLECAARFDQLKAVFVSLEGLSDVELNRDLSMDILTALRPRSQFSRFVKWGSLAQFVVAAAILWIVLPKVFSAWQPFFAQASENLLVSISRGLNIWITQITAGLAALQLDWSRWWPPSLFTPVQPEISQWLDWPILVSVGLLFLIGNSLLLRHVTRNGSR